MPTTFLCGRPEDLLQRPHHRVERVGDADDEGVGGVFLDAGADLLHDLQVDGEEIVAAHAGLARHAGGDDADFGVVEGFVRIGAGVVRVKTVDRRGLGDVERLALRHALGDVEHHHVAQFFQADEMSQRSADLTGANQSNLVARHVNLSFRHVKEGKTETGGYPFRSPRSSRWMPNCRALANIEAHPCHSGARRKSRATMRNCASENP
ncbi:hypothetical protein ACVWZ3_008998 [Bradyrhizobium sp. i1.3.6]